MSSALDFFISLSDHLLSQGQKCCTKQGKPMMFRGELRDPVGSILLKKKWKKEFDRTGIYNDSVKEILNLPEDQEEILKDIQAIHDIIIPEKWPEWLEMFKRVHFPSPEVSKEVVDDDIDLD